ASLLDDAAMIEFAAEVFADCVTTEEGIEGTRSFLEKRRPAWAGEA
ncbi:isohexenylglutaconyl-CoA hydratase, partial [Belnapia rosea]